MITIKDWSYAFLMYKEDNLDMAFEATKNAFINYLEGGDENVFGLWWNNTALLLRSEIFRNKFTEPKKKILWMYGMSFIWRLTRKIYGNN